MAKDFSNPKKLGLMRFFQVVFAFGILATLGLLVFVVKGNEAIEPIDVLFFLTLIFKGISFWLIWQRKKAARVLIIAFSLFNIAASVLENGLNGTLNLTDQLITSSFDLVVILYFLTSRRAKAVLIQPFSVDIKQGKLAQGANYYRPKTWAFWRNIIIYFCVFSVVGHWMEAGYCTLIRFGLLPGIYDPNSQIWSDWLYPFVVYGFGAVACVLLLYPIKNVLERKLKSRVGALAVSFVINAFVCTLIELAMGLMLNQPLPDGTMPLWDYRDMFGNFMGQVCLQNAVAFGIVATVMTWVVYPAMESLLGRVSNDVMNIAFVAVVVSFSILFFLYCVNVLLPDLESASPTDVVITADDVAPGVS